MQQLEFRNVVKNSLREAFYTNPKESFYIGTVDSNGLVKAKKCDENSCLMKSHMSHGFYGGMRWRYLDHDETGNHYSNVVSWTDGPPSHEDMDVVDNFLNRNGIKPAKHIELGGLCIYKDGDEYLTETISVDKLTEDLKHSHKVRILVNHEFGEEYNLDVTGLISKNTKWYEDDYRLTWFNRNNHPKGHVALNEEDYDYIIKNEDLPMNLKTKLSAYFECNPESIGLKFEKNNSLKEALDKTNEYIGVVDSMGVIHAKKVPDATVSHESIFNRISGDRWRFDGDEIVWTNNPSEDSMFTVENYLIKQHEHPESHYIWTTKIKTVGTPLQIKEVVFTKLSEKSRKILKECLHSFFDGTDKELNSWMN